ncbi:aminotransferase [Roseibium aquae]|uniref:Aminotransferase n=1 Tax=Roseibium aquae TaxID=1323746 RepID=A0A916X0L0_9HYPH|nr:aminotransferase [Roseibium aquae]
MYGFGQNHFWGNTVLNLLDLLTPETRNAPESGIVELVNCGREQENLIPLWVGEGDLPTPDFISNAASASLAAGETFYTYQRGIPALREALAAYHSRVYGMDVPAEEIFVTGSGMQAIQIAAACVASAGDEVLVPTPAWPNMAAAVEIRGAKAVPVPMDYADGAWSLDLARLGDAVTPRTRAIFLNTPCNPTGWVASLETLNGILALARERGLWIIADEIYGRFHFGAGDRAPSFHDVSGPQDPILYVNSMSKNWAMTGWRIGWIRAPRVLGQVLENMIQYSTSGVPVFVQRGAVAALTEGEDFLSAQISRAEQGRRIVMDGLSAVNRIHFAPPVGAFYLFLGIEGVTDTRRFALDLLRETGVGLAPGSAFGDAGKGFLRLCFARRHDHLEDAVGRIQAFMQRD